ncbi:MAG TPA: PEP-CTERM sorting domain-containing protein [Fimbriimonadaceae bacterium]|nr:PEP-CTERM sorting domain-containing protein [Fimbriimonadaceae bacterium]
MHFSRLAWVAAFGSLAAFSLGQDSFDPLYDTLSALIDTSGTTSSQTQYDVLFSHSGSDPDTYINDLVLTPGSNWDDDIDFSVASGQFNYNFNSGYTFGTAISGDQFWQITDVVSRFGSISNVDPGFYDFTLDFIGGEDANAADTLASVGFTLEVVDSISLAVSGVATPGTIMIGQQTSISMSVENLMASRNFVSTTWYYSGVGLATVMQNVGFFGDWFDKTITPGSTRTDEHTRWLATGSTPLGTHVGEMGVFGGFYYGDWHGFRMDPEPEVTVIVPEPATFAVLGLGLLAVRKRRRA